MIGLGQRIETSPLWFLATLLILMFLSVRLGVLLVWGAVAGITFAWRQRKVSYRRVAILESLLEQNIDDEEIPTEYSLWANTLLSKIWTTYATEINTHNDYIISKLNQIQSASLASCRFKEEGFSLGTKSPIIEKIATHSFLASHEFQMDVDFIFIPNRTFAILVSPAPLLPEIELELSSLVMKGKARINVTMHALHFNLSTLSISLLSNPSIDFKLSICKKGDLMGIPLIYHWAQDAVGNSFSALTWPRDVSFQLPNSTAFLPFLEPMKPAFDGPIMEIGITRADEILPEGWELIQRSVTGKFSADVNRGSSHPELYICYRRGIPGDKNETLRPITGVCIHFPEKEEHVPVQFSQITKSFTQNGGNLNAGGIPCTLCYTRREGEPIRGLQIFNKSCERTCPSIWTVIELSTEGHKANLNKGKEDADEIFMVFAGGAAGSPFGYEASKGHHTIGLLKVTITSAMNILSADEAGSYDTYADAYVSYSPTEKEVSKINRTCVAEKTLNPKWEMNSIFRASSVDTLNVVVYQSQMLKDDVIGVLKFPLDVLQIRTPVTDWYELQSAVKGHVLLTMEALNFGLSKDSVSHPIHQIDVTKARKIRKFKTVERPSKVALPSLSIRKLSPIRSKLFEDEDLDFPTSSYEISESVDENIQPLKGYLDFTRKGKQAKRWIVAKDGQLMCFKSPKDKTAQEIFSLKDATVTRTDQHLLLRNLYTRWDLFVLQDGNVDEWYIELKRHIAWTKKQATSRPE